MTKQELIEQGFKYIATQNCEQKTEVWRDLLDGKI